MALLLLEYPSPNPSKKPFAPVELYTEGILEEIVLDWVWSNGGKDCLFKRGWMATLVDYNFQHPKMVASVQKAHEEQIKILSVDVWRYPHH